MQLQTLVLEESPETAIWGHARRGFDPPCALEDKPVKGTFKVTVVTPNGEVVVAETGPEPRPFPDLKALDLPSIAEDVLDVLDALEGAAADEPQLAKRARRSDGERDLEDVDGGATVEAAPPAPAFERLTSWQDSDDFLRGGGKK